SFAVFEISWVVITDTASTTFYVILILLFVKFLSIGGRILRVIEYSKVFSSFFIQSNSFVIGKQFSIITDGGNENFSSFRAYRNCSNGTDSPIFIFDRWAVEEINISLNNHSLCGLWLSTIRINNSPL